MGRVAYSQLQQTLDAGFRMALPKVSHRHYLSIQNQDAAAVLFVSLGSPKQQDASSKIIKPDMDWVIENGAPSEEIWISSSAPTSSVNIIEGVIQE